MQSISVEVARNLYKLMAIKDEYEVARLYSNGEFLRKLDQQFEGDYALRFNLAPPLFSKRDPNTGHLLKREFGPWMLRVFGALARLRFLRGSALDVFNATQERRQERQDLVDYLALLDQLLPALNQDNYAAALALVRLPAKLRGFGHVKDRNRALLAPRRAELLDVFHGGTAAPVTVVNAA
jgi:indolepyruvate ferredoxin oxidoreductase